MIAITWKLEQFLMSVENNPRLHCFCFTSHCDWSRKLALLSYPCEITNHELVVRVFPHFGSFLVFALSSHWLFRLTVVIF